MLNNDYAKQPVLHQSIQLFVPTFDIEECLVEIRECLEKGWTGIGYKTVQFEDEWKKYTGHVNAHFLSSATAGLNLAFEILKETNGWNDDSEVITTPLTFVSSNHAIMLANMKAVFADVDDTMCLDPESIEQHITPKTRAVLFVGIGGNTGHYDEVLSICKKYNLKLILDAAHMAGSRWRGKAPGLDADVTVYSYQAVKNLPTADSGMICFQDEHCDAIARKKSWLGINKDTYSRASESGNKYKWKYDVEYVGYKYNGNSIMAAIALAQLKRLDLDNAYRRQVVKWYTAGFQPYKDKIRLVEVPEDCDSSCHLFQILVDDRDNLMLRLNEQGIYPGVHYVDNTNYGMYAYAKGSCRKSAYASDHAISLPLHLRLSYEDVQRVISSIIDFVS